MKVVGLGLVSILTACYPGMISPHQDGLLQMFAYSHEGADIGVRVAALKAACSYLQRLIPGAVASASLWPKMTSVVEAAADSGDPVAAQEAREVVDGITIEQSGAAGGYSEGTSLETSCPPWKKLMCSGHPFQALRQV
ncbi:unnamed protein product [Ectocarpus sp. CCAP 1310/34]|nr:unnamed protein product [Ectocarpus sp. CCAP 1310/34]